MKKVIFLTPGLNMGGAERWVLTLASSFTKVKTHFILNIMGQENDILQEEAKQICPVYTCKNDINLINKLCEEADVIISWGCPQLSKLDIKCPVVEVSHSDPMWPMQRNLIKNTIYGATHYVGVSQTAASAFPEYCNATTLYNGIDLKRLEPTKTRSQMRSEWNLDEERLILFMGGEKVVKNPMVVKEVGKILPKDYKILFVSNKNFEAPGIKVINPDIQVGNLYNAADILLMPSMYEGMPLTLLEAWSFGLPTVTTKYSAYEELTVLHGQELSWSTEVSPSPPVLLEQVINAYHGRGSERILEAKCTVFDYYTTQHMVDRWENYLLEILNDN